MSILLKKENASCSAKKNGMKLNILRSIIFPRGKLPGKWKYPEIRSESIGIARIPLSLKRERSTNTRLTVSRKELSSCWINYYRPSLILPQTGPADHR